MDTDDIARAVATARAAVGASEDATAVAQEVRRLDRPGAYVLVGITDGADGWIAAVDDSGRLMSRASDPAGASAWWIDPDLELVWAPGSSSRSPLYPLRRSVEGGTVTFLDHTGAAVSFGPDQRG